MIRDSLKPATSLIRSVFGTNGMAEQMSVLEAKIDEMTLRLQALDAAAASRRTGIADARVERIDQKGFVSTSLPSGKVYELSVDQDSSDSWHAAVSANVLNGPNWHFLMAWLRPDDVFFDLGANIGTMSIPAAVAGCHVTAFEMLGANIAHLERAIARNQLTNISVIAGALSDRPGFAGLGGTSAWGTVTPHALVSVPTVVIDDYVQQRATKRVDVIKIDIEGSEQKALIGAADLLDRDHPDIVIESNSATCGAFGMSYRDLFRLLLGHAYRLYRILPDSLAPWCLEMVQEAVAPDYLATTKDEAAITARCGWPIRPMTDADFIASILESAKYDGAPRLHILAVADRLPASVRSDPRVAKLLEEWQPMMQDSAFETIRLGSS
jgi:FkbM family methyltransferase